MVHPTFARLPWNHVIHGFTASAKTKSRRTQPFSARMALACEAIRLCVDLEQAEENNTLGHNMASGKGIV
jgi:hypothetical protein